MLRQAVQQSFNMISVDGDTSTNDCVFLLANGAAGGAVKAGSTAETAVREAVQEVCRVLAEAIAVDGEGATKLIVIKVAGGRSVAQAEQVARTVATSLLVKSAVHGGDPNWGRVLAAAGRAGVPLDPRRFELRIGGHLVATGGMAHPAGERGAAEHLQGKRVELALKIGQGKATAEALGCDLTAEYVRINAHYRT
jgi:glutamate N-acetyltransferase/amino-acid N-acetyltransferase